MGNSTFNEAFGGNRRHIEQEPRAHIAFVTRSEPKIRLGTRVIDFIVLACQEAPNSPKH